jgi:protein ImuA
MVDREKGRPYGPGLTGFGLDPRQTIHVVTHDIDDMLKATEDSLRCGALGAVLCEPWGEAKSLDLTATRRLTLAAEMSGVPLIMLRRGHGDMPTAARTRWRIAPAPSAHANTTTTGPGHAHFSVSLVLNRQRDAAAPQGFWIMEWSHGERIFRSADHVGDLSLSADRPPDTVGARSRRAAR